MSLSGQFQVCLFFLREGFEHKKRLTKQKLTKKNKIKQTINNKDNF